MKNILPTAAAISLLASTAFTQTILVDDQFTDGSKLKTGALDAAFFTQGSGTAASIQSDDTTGPNEGGNDNALELTVGGQGFRGLVAAFTPFSLVSTGDNITLTLDLRYTADPGNAAAGFRFGLYNSNATPVIADATTLSGDDDGYAARFPTGGNTTAVTIGEEDGAGGGALPTSGSDVSVLSGGTDGTVTSISGTTNYYRLQLSITRNSLGGLDFVASQGVNTPTLTTAYSVTDATPITTTFDEIVLFNGSVTQAFRVDNVLVTVVPEPSTFAMLFGGLGMLIGTRRFRRGRNA